MGAATIHRNAEVSRFAITTGAGQVLNFAGTLSEMRTEVEELLSDGLKRGHKLVWTESRFTPGQARCARVNNRGRELDFMSVARLEEAPEAPEAPDVELGTEAPREAPQGRREAPGAPEASVPALALSEAARRKLDRLTGDFVSDGIREFGSLDAFRAALSLYNGPGL